MLLLACFFSAFLTVDSVRKVDLHFDEEYQFATDQRSNFVISHDFGWVKESLVTLHRDHWIEKKQNQQLYRNNSMLLGFLVLVLMWTTYQSFSKIRRKA